MVYNTNPASASKKFILILSKYVLTDTEEAVLMKGFNFLVTNPHSNLDMACAVESVVSKLPQTRHGIQVEDQVHVREV
jgi:hypothetical protein